MGMRRTAWRRPAVRRSSLKDVYKRQRLAYAKNGKVFIRSGAGIVADSEPEKEYQECINKAKAVMTALEMAEGGIDR